MAELFHTYPSLFRSVRLALFIPMFTSVKGRAGCRADPSPLFPWDRVTPKASPPEDSKLEHGMSSSFQRPARVSQVSACPRWCQAEGGWGMSAPGAPDASCVLATSPPSPFSRSTTLPPAIPERVRPFLQPAMPTRLPPHKGSRSFSVLHTQWSTRAPSFLNPLSRNPLQTHASS